MINKVAAERHTALKTIIYAMHYISYFCWYLHYLLFMLLTFCKDTLFLNTKQVFRHFFLFPYGFILNGTIITQAAGYM